MDAAGRRRLRRLRRHYVINAVASTPPRHINGDAMAATAAIMDAAAAAIF